MIVMRCSIEVQSAILEHEGHQGICETGFDLESLLFVDPDLEFGEQSRVVLGRPDHHSLLGVRMHSFSLVITDS